MLLLLACEPYQDVKIALETPVAASFDMVVDPATPNYVTFTSTSEGTFLYRWDLGNGSSADSASVTAYYPKAGTYTVTLTAFSQGGNTTASKTVTIAQDDSPSCTGNLELLTGCGTKTWKLDPNPNALHVGPTVDQTWWGNGAGDVTGRACLFNDRYTFSVNGEYQFDNKGDFWADDNGAGQVFPPALGLSIGCHPASDWPAAYKAWDSGTHSFEITGTTLRVIGLGAHIGLYKLGDGAEVLEPDDAITYQISEISESRLVVYANYGVGVWRFTFIPE